MSAGGYTYLYAFVNAPITANVPVILYDISTLIPEVLPNGAFVSGVYFSTGTYSGDATISIGWNGNINGVVPASAGITTTTLNSIGQSYVPTGTVNAVNSDTTLMLMSSANVTSGTINVVVGYQAYNNFP